ncbi:hypothetical protein CPB85DRAFT_1288067 [Mucidula mucida]|nr:hypothetical protein CPB85DRAFT_1288067 [Mucidula mucida]
MKTGASFAENFYGLKRRRRPFVEPVREKAAREVYPLGTAAAEGHYRSLLFLVGVPYFRAKAQDYYEDLGGGVSADIMNVNTDIRLIDLRAAAVNAGKASPSQKLGILALIRHLITRSPQLLLDSLRLLLPTGWWYSPGSPARSLSTSPLGPAVPAPKMLPPHPRGISFDRQQYGMCPLCHEAINNATALPSGYVFCYRCAYDQVEKHGMCPVTLLPTRVWQLRKVLV